METVFDLFLVTKWLHILSSTVLFGTGMGTAFFMWMAHRSDDPSLIAGVGRLVVLADWLFTLPSGLLQPLTGAVLIGLAGYDPHASWLMVTYGLYAVALSCWLPVVRLQISAQKLAALAVAGGTPLPPLYYAKMRAWFILGWPAFISLVAIFALMVTKPVLF